MNVGGLVLDQKLGDDTCPTWVQGDGQSCDISVADFFGRAEEHGGEAEDSPIRYMVSLPMGTGLGPTVKAAAASASATQRAQLDAHRVMAARDALSRP